MRHMRLVSFFVICCLFASSMGMAEGDQFGNIFFDFRFFNSEQEIVDAGVDFTFGTVYEERIIGECTVLGYESSLLVTLPNERQPQDLALVFSVNARKSEAEEVFNVLYNELTDKWGESTIQMIVDSKFNIILSEFSENFSEDYKKKVVSDLLAGKTNNRYLCCWEMPGASVALYASGSRSWFTREVKFDLMFNME